jgi:hypothetical protein
MDEKFAVEIDHVTRIYKRDEFEVRVWRVGALTPHSSIAW